MNNKIWHSYQTRIPNHAWGEMEVNIEFSRPENTTTVTVSVDDGKPSVIVFTLEELRGLIVLGERFEYAYNHMIDGRKTHNK